MFGRKKKQKNADKKQANNKNGARDGAKIPKNRLGRKTWGFPCSPDISARVKLLADQLQIPEYALAEHLTQVGAELVARLAQDHEEATLLQQHIREQHVAARTIEKIAQYDEEMADILHEEWQQRLRIETTVRQIVTTYVRRGMRLAHIVPYIELGVRASRDALRNPSK